MWSIVRGDQMLNFTNGYQRDFNKDLHITVMGYDSATSGMVSHPVQINSIYNMPSKKLAWYYWALIVLGVLILGGGVFLLVSLKDEKDVELEYGEGYSSVFDAEKKEDKEFYD